MMGAATLGTLCGELGRSLPAGRRQGACIHVLIGGKDTAGSALVASVD